MTFWQRALIGFSLTTLLVVAVPIASLEQLNANLLTELQQVHGLDSGQLDRIRQIFKRSSVMGQGNPVISVHPMTRAQCRSARDQAPLSDDLATFRRICGAPHMAPLYDPAREPMESARACIDQYEFPDIPCEYPVVWVRAKEAAEICQAMGKRLCDAHEWEGSCAGQLLAPDYRFQLAQRGTVQNDIRDMRNAHNRAYADDKRWSYGPRYQRGLCATGGQKTTHCSGGGWNNCGSNTFPSGAFPACKSPLGVYDLHGNAAEHMNLPLNPQQMASQGSQTLGHTEMKGSWFVFDSFYAHEDWCRWRAPYWHGSRVLDPNSHANYHLGFRCCKTLANQ